MLYLGGHLRSKSPGTQYLGLPKSQSVGTYLLKQTAGALNGGVSVCGLVEPAGGWLCVGEGFSCDVWSE